jgi:hypothetical protein
MQTITFSSLGPSNLSSVLSGYRDLRMQGRGLIVIAAIHVDIADDNDDERLASVLDQVLDSAAALSATIDTTGALGAMHSAARGTGRYFSAAVIRIGDNHAEVSRCGFASLITTTPGAVLLAPQLLRAGEETMLANALGARSFQLPLDVAKVTASAAGAVAVGGVLEPSDRSVREQLSSPHIAPRLRGGVALLFG